MKIIRENSCNSWLKKWFPLGFLIIFTFLLYINTLNNSFILKDRYRVQSQPGIRSLKNIPFFFGSDYRRRGLLLRDEYRPIRDISFAIDYFLYKDKSPGWRLSSIFLHLINVVLVYFFVIYLFRISDFGFRICAFITALLFAAHPVHTESINWLKCRTDVTCLIFYLLSLIFFLKSQSEGRHPEKIGVNSGRPLPITDYRLPITSYLLSLVCFLLALAGKMMALTLPLTLSLYIFFLGTDQYRKGVLGKALLSRLQFSLSYFKSSAVKILNFGKPHLVTLPFWGTLFVYSFLLHGPGLIAVHRGPCIVRITLYQRILLIFKTIFFYIKTLLFPASLCMERPCPIPESIFQKDVLLSVFIVLLLILITVGLYLKRDKVLSFSVLLIWLTLIPASNLRFLALRPLSEERLYIPSLGFCLFLGIIIQRIMQKRKFLGVGVLSVILGFYSIRTIIRNFDWKDGVTLYSKAVKSFPESLWARYYLAKEYSGSRFYNKAIAEYKAVLAINSHFAPAYEKLGWLYAKGGLYEQAIDEYKEAIKFAPEVPFPSEARVELAVLYTKIGLSNEAIEEYKEILKINFTFVDARNNLAILYIEKGLYDEATEQYEEILKIEPDSIKALKNLGVVYYKKGMYERAVEQYKKALQINPADWEAHHNLGLVYHKIGLDNQAIKEYKKVLEIVPKAVPTRFNLALVYLHKKLYPQAREQFEKVLQLDPNNPAARKYLQAVSSRQMTDSR